MFFLLFIIFQTDIAGKEFVFSIITRKIYTPKVSTATTYCTATFHNSFFMADDWRQLVVIKNIPWWLTFLTQQSIDVMQNSKMPFEEYGVTDDINTLCLMGIINFGQVGALQKFSSNVDRKQTGFCLGFSFYLIWSSVSYVSKSAK